jgi:ERCC4-related helicase
VQLSDHLEAKRVGSQSGENSVTRCMIFCSFREGVNELVVGSIRSFFRELCSDEPCLMQEMLNKHPLIRAHKFVGRAQGKDMTDKGLTQKEQKTVSDLFPE